MDPGFAPRDRANRMFDAYGALLTAQQRRLLQRYYQDDLSLGEIAEQMRVTRQAVHDGLRRALVAMERYERALGLVAAGRPAGARRGGEHYFTPSPTSPRRPALLRATLRGAGWAFEAAAGVFSHRRLDPGTRLLIETMRVGRADRVLDLGCGYGPIGLVAASLAPRGGAWLVDANVRAARLALANAARNRLRNVRVIVGDAASAVQACSMDVVFTNPPIRAGRRVVRAFIDDAWRVLRPGGRFYLVARTAQGAKTLARLIDARFGAVREVALARGYRVFEAARTPEGGAAVHPDSRTERALPIPSVHEETARV